MKRTAWWTCLGVAGLATSLLFAEPGVVKTKDGGSFEGDIKESGGNVTVTMHGASTVIPRADVLSIEKVNDYDQDFLSRLAKLDSKDTAGKITLAREAFEKGKNDLARQAAEAALLSDPNSTDATDLLRLVQSQIRMERARPAPGVTPTPTPAPAPAIGGSSERPLLTTVDIANIRRKELRPGDTSARVRFDGDVKKRYADSQNVPFADFNMLSSLNQALQILANGDDSMRNQVVVTSDPDSLIIYRRQIQPLVMQNCATTGCHGASAGGGFMMLSPTENDAVTYTNFYILESYAHGASNASGIFAQQVQRLVQRGHGEQSLLANYGLPATIGQYDHPLVKGKAIQPIFRNREDARYLTVVDWMDNRLSPIEPNYGIHYTPPLPTTMPVATPSAP